MTTLFALLLLLVLAGTIAGGRSLTTLVLDSEAEPAVTRTSVQDLRVGEGKPVSQSTAVLTVAPREERPVVDGDLARPRAATAVAWSAIASWAYDAPVVSRVGLGLAIRMEAVSGDEVAASQLVDALGRGVNRRDADGSVIEELGWSWSAWNGMSRSPASVSVTCGATTSSVGVLNSFVLRFPDPSDEGASGLYERQAAIDVLLAISGAWEPDVAVVTSSELRELLDRNSDRPAVGWVTYLASARPVPQVIAGVDLLPAAAGTVLALQKHWATVDAKDVEALTDVLGRSGALSPIA